MTLTLLRRRLAMVVLMALSALNANAVQAAIPASERAVLLNLYATTNGDSWTRRDNWNGPVGTECTWFGIQCDQDGNAVTAISLAGNKLSGSLPSDLNKLANLRNLHVQSNELTGAIPELAGLVNLITLDVQENRLTGQIPTLTGLSKLTWFRAWSNHLSGSIPSLAGLDSLAFFAVGNNRLAGPIPSLAGMTNLRTFEAEINQLTGPIPSLDGLTLYVFAVGYNRLSGSIPSFDRVVALADFAANDNELTGTIPSLVGVASLNSIDVRNNQLTGLIPSLHGLQIRRLLLDNNQLTGPIPSFDGLTNLGLFWAENNRLSGPIPPLTGLTRLQGFRVAGNNLTGAVPPVPNPNALVASGSTLCPNLLDHTPSPAWDTATGVRPWYTNCAASPLPPVAVIPTLSEWTLGALALLLLATGVGAARRRAR
jgi:Leucine-rich repeat (LRR) protein